MNRMEKIIDNVVNLIQGAANKKSCEVRYFPLRFFFLREADCFTL
jgi:hypothetical protein